MPTPTHTLRPPGRRRRPAFTLIELMVVITLLVVFLGIALPVLRAITGSRSTEAARNVISAMLGRARNEALARHQLVGVALFVDPATNRSTLALVGVGTVDPTAASAQQAWTHNDSTVDRVTIVGTSPVQYRPGDVVYRLAAYSTTNNANYPPGSVTETLLPPHANIVKPTVRAFQCILSHAPYDGAAPSNADNPAPVSQCAPGTGTAWAAYWGALQPTGIDTLEGIYEPLPANVGVELINHQPAVATVANPVDRYLRTGVVVFDETGKIVTVPYSISGASALGKRAGVNLAVGTPAVPMESQVGFALYESGGLTEQPFYSANDFNLSKVDTRNKDNAGTLYAPIPGLAAPTDFATEQQEESWIDSNADLYFVNRQTGAMQRAQ